MHALYVQLLRTVDIESLKCLDAWRMFNKNHGVCRKDINLETALGENRENLGAVGGENEKSQKSRPWVKTRNSKTQSTKPGNNKKLSQNVQRGWKLAVKKHARKHAQLAANASAIIPADAVGLVSGKSESPRHVARIRPTPRAGPLPNRKKQTAEQRLGCMGSKAHLTMVWPKNPPPLVVEPQAQSMRLLNFLLPVRPMLLDPDADTVRIVGHPPAFHAHHFLFLSPYPYPPVTSLSGRDEKDFVSIKIVTVRTVSPIQP